MSSTIYFMQECPTCGRQLRIRVTYLGKLVVCQHCQATLEAVDPDSPTDWEESSSEILRRADRLLESASHLRSSPR